MVLSSQTSLSRAELWGCVFLATLVALLGCESGSSPVPPHSSLEQNLNGDWQFTRLARPNEWTISELDTLRWESVDIPHTPRLEPLVVNDLWQGQSLYRRTIRVDDVWRGSAVWLKFEGAMASATVWLNGTQVAQHVGGYLPFTVDLSEEIVFGDQNELIVLLDNTDNPLTGPKPTEILDFLMYGGLYRNVSLQVKNRLHISDEQLADRVGGGGVFVKVPQITSNRAELGIQTHVQNTDQRKRQFHVRQTLVDKHTQKVVATTYDRAITLPPGGEVNCLSTMTVPSPKLWSPNEPNLHVLTTEIVEAGRVVDVRRTTVGLRRIELREDGIWINGSKHRLRGVNRHQEYPYIGYAVPDPVQYRDAKLIKEAGFDYVRLSHYPQSPAFMDAADELGIVVINAILGWQYFNEDPRFSDYVVDACRRLIRRDRNHPSVIAWECSLNETDMPQSLVDSLHNAVHEEYPSDLTYSAGWVPDTYDVFLQARQHRLKHYSEPKKPYVVSEYGDWEYYAQNAGLNQDAWEDLAPEERTSRQLLEHGERRLLQQALNVQEAHNDNFSVPAFADGYWVMFDYNRGYATDLEASGVASIDRRPKFSYDFFLSQRDPGQLSKSFASGPMVSIASYWTQYSSLPVRVYSNAEEVELFLNGRQIARKTPDRDSFSSHLAHPPFSFPVSAFEPGELVANAYIEGNLVATDKVKTPGQTNRLEISVDDSGVPISDNDAVFVRATVLDKEGTRVVTENGKVTFSVECPEDEAWLAHSPHVPIKAGVSSALLRIVANPALCRVTASFGTMRDSVLLSN